MAEVKAQVQQAQELLHREIDSLDKPHGVVLATPRGPKSLVNRYFYVVRALRKFINVGGKPFEDEKFRAFFQQELKRAEEKAVTTWARKRAEKFAKTVLRICGWEWGPGGIRHHRSRLEPSRSCNLD